MSPRRARRTAALLAGSLLVLGCGQAAGPGTAPEPTGSTTPTAPTGSPTRPTSPPTTAPTRASSSPPPACSDAGVIERWSAARLAAAVLSVPLKDFDLASVSSEVRDGVGAILFLGGGAPPPDLGTRLAALSAAAPGRSHPLVLADEEGGGIQRLAPLVSSFGWARDLARSMSPAAVRVLAARVGRQLRAAGVSVDLAPVADVDDRPGPSATNPDGSRSFSGDPATAAAYTVAFAQGLRDGGVLPVVKHFPGLGGAKANTDVGPAATFDITRLRSTGLVPFTAAIRAGLPAIMIGNASVPGLTTLPASLSHAVITGLLHDELGFRGLVVTDSMTSGGVLTGGRTLTQAVVTSLAAGADLVLFGSTLTVSDQKQLSTSGIRRAFTAIVGAITAGVAAGTLPLSRLRAAALAVVRANGRSLCG